MLPSTEAAEPDSTVQPIAADEAAAPLLSTQTLTSWSELDAALACAVIAPKPQSFLRALHKQLAQLEAKDSPAMAQTSAHQLQMSLPALVLRLQDYQRERLSDESLVTRLEQRRISGCLSARPALIAYFARRLYQAAVAAADGSSEIGIELLRCVDRAANTLQLSGPHTAVYALDMLTTEVCKHARRAQPTRKTLERALIEGAEQIAKNPAWIEAFASARARNDKQEKAVPLNPKAKTVGGYNE